MPDLAGLLAATLGRSLGPTEPLAVAVSGGPDSVALLLLAHTAFPGRVTALTVDHALRPESAAEATILAAACTAAGIPCAILTWADPATSRSRANLQARARAARYALLTRWCADHGIGLLLTAHHADDQAETLLLRLARGSGTAGLAGIRATRSLGQGVTLARPLLSVRRAELAAIAVASGWPLVADPANHDPRFDRTQARALLARTPWLAAPRLAAAAAHAAEVEAALAWTTDLAWAGRALQTATTIDLDRAGLPPELQRRLVLRALTTLAPAGPPPDGPALARLIARLTQGGTATLAGVRARGGSAGWRFTTAPRRRVPVE